MIILWWMFLKLFNNVTSLYFNFVLWRGKIIISHRWSDRPVFMTDMNALFKLKTKKLKYISTLKTKIDLNSDKRIAQPKTEKQLRQKYLDIRINI